MPRHISFSGNGSKVIRVITTDTKLLANYTKLVFERVLGKSYGKELDLLGLEKIPILKKPLVRAVSLERE